jgi:hypothetical protein
MIFMIDKLPRTKTIREVFWRVVVISAFIQRESEALTRKADEMGSPVALPSFIQLRKLSQLGSVCHRLDRWERRREWRLRDRVRSPRPVPRFNQNEKSRCRFAAGAAIGNNRYNSWLQVWKPATPLAPTGAVVTRLKNQIQERKGGRIAQPSISPIQPDLLHLPTAEMLLSIGVSPSTSGSSRVRWVDLPCGCPTHWTKICELAGTAPMREP